MSAKDNTAAQAARGRIATGARTKNPVLEQQARAELALAKTEAHALQLLEAVDQYRRAVANMAAASGTAQEPSP